MTPNFTLRELTVTTTGIANQPREFELVKLFYLATFLLEPIRARWGPLNVTSAFRSPQVNAAVGGKAEGQHPHGEAADFRPARRAVMLEEVFRWIVLDSGLIYGEAILEVDPEDRVIHLSLPRLGKRPETLILEGGTYRPFTA